MKKNFGCLLSFDKFEQDLYKVKYCKPIGGRILMFVVEKHINGIAFDPLQAIELMEEFKTQNPQLKDFPELVDQYFERLKELWKDKTQIGPLCFEYTAKLIRQSKNSFLSYNF